MMTPYLEELIRDGAAKYHTMAIGGSGVGTIPVQQNEKVVITDFTWHPFCDVNPVNVIGEFDYFPIVDLNLQIIAPGVISPGDLVDAYALLVNKGTMLVTGVSGNAITGYIISGDFFGTDNFVDTTSGATGQILNIQVPTFAIPGNEVINIASGASGIIVTNTPLATLFYSPGTLVLQNVIGTFSNNDPISTIDQFPNPEMIQDGAISETVNFGAQIQLAIESCIHHLRFKSKGINEIFNFRDTPTPIIPVIHNEELALNALLGFTLPDPIHIPCYITCEETVQIDIWKFSPSGNTFTQGNPSPIANEPNVPNGYQGAVANPPVIDILTGQGSNIRPLGMREDTVVLARKKDQFIDDVGDLTELTLPFSNQSFPLVNVGYVLIDNSVK